MKNFQDIVNLITKITDENLRNVYQQSDFRKVILPLTVIKRLDDALKNTKHTVHNVYTKMNNPKVLTEQQERTLVRVSGVNFFNISQFSFDTLLDDADNIKENFYEYLHGFSTNASDIIKNFNFDVQIEKMSKEGILYSTLKGISNVDLHPKNISNMDMGYAFEELIRRFSENVEAGQHYTPREVIKLMVELLFQGEDAELKRKGITKSIYDGTSGTGGMLSAAEEYVLALNPAAKLTLYGQEINEETFAICKSDMLLKGHDAENIKQGNTLTSDQLPTHTFDFIIANPPYGENWARYKKTIEDEYKLGENGRFAAGLPRTSDGSFLFLQHMVSKMKPVTESNPTGSRLAIVLSGSPLFTGAAGSGESEIRKYLLENDLVEAIVGLPNNLFYNTGINTYIWILANHKPEHRKGKVQLIDASNFYTKMKKSMGEKRHEISSAQIADIKTIYQNFESSNVSKIFRNEEFGYSRITVEQPLRLNYRFESERIDKVKNEAAFQKLSIEEQDILVSVLSEQNNQLYTSSVEFHKQLNKLLGNLPFKVNASLKNAIMNGLSQKDEQANVVLDSKKQPVADSDLRDYENVPLFDDVAAYFQREVLPHVPQAWIDHEKTKIGYEIPFTRHFYQYVPLRDSSVIRAELEANEKELLSLMEGLFDETI